MQSNDAKILANDFVSQWNSIGPAALRAFERVGKRGWYILGEEVAFFERALATRFEVTHAIGCANGLDAIELGLRALGLKAGDRVVTTPFSAFATTLAILRAGGKPVFVDIDEHGLIDLNLCEKAFESDSELRYFVPVHLFGHALNLEKLAALKKRFGLKIVEDCAQAILARHRDQSVGSVGDVTAVSFYPTKNLGALGDAGAALTSNDALAARLKSLRDYGQTKKYEHTELGMNSRLDEVHAAVLHDAFLPKLEEWTETRRSIAAEYSKSIQNPAIEIMGAPQGSKSVWHLFPTKVRAESRASFMNHLASNGIVSGIHYPITIPDQKAITDLKDPRPAQISRARELAQTEVSLPIHPFLSTEQIDRVVEACNRWKPTS